MSFPGKMIADSPDIPIITGPTFILDGNSVTLTCTSTGGNPAPTVYWYRVNKLLDTTFNTTNGVTTNTYNFVANGSHHIAVFECRVNSSELESYLSATWYFQVYIEPSQPTLTGPQTLLTGNTYQWTCISTGGNPSPTMTLRIGNSQFSTGITQSSVLQSDSTHTVTVSLSWNPSISNNGQTLFCDVQHSETRGNNLQTASLQLTVNDPLSVNAPQTQYQQNVGTLVVMNCVITGTATSISWYFNNQVINIASSSKYSNGNTINPSLTVSNVALSDAGQYYCQATNGLVTANSNTITLTVLDIPSVNLQQSIYNVNYGSSVVLVCSVTANPVHTTVYWRKIKNGVTTDINVVNSNNKYSGSSVSSPSLQINNVDLNDEAYYVCFATNSVGSGQSSQTFLDVIGGFLNITIPQSSYSVLIGQQVTISCTVTGTPTQTNVFWSKVVNGVLTNVGINGNGRYSGGTTSAPSLTITNTQRSDEGTYVCYATNIVGTSNSQNTFLDVTGGVPIVQVSFLRYQINFGGSITLGCSVVSNPAHFQVYWRKTIGGTTSNVDVTNSGGKYSGSTLLIPTLTINNAALSDEANYTCYATNIVGTGQSATTLLDVVGNLPTVSIQQSIYNVNYGSSVVLVCSVTANPAHTTVYWRKIKNGITTDITVANSNNKYSGSSVSSPSLQINNADLTDEGHYACFATNVIGTAQSAQAFLDVTGGLLTITIPQSSYSVLIGQQVTISCTVTGTPTQNNVFWRKVANGVQIDLDINENSRYSGGTSPTPSLTITNTQRSDEGIYVCYATNIVGTSNSQNTFLDVTGGVPIVQVSFLRYQINFGGSITLGCSVVSNPANFQVYWRKTIGGTTSNIDVTNSGGKYSGSTLLIPTLTINDAALSDEANYTCYATNIVGTGQSATTLLDVVGNQPTVSIQQPIYNVNYGSSVVLVCTVTANPAHTTVYWRKIKNGITTDITVANSNNKYSGSSVSSPSLQINNADLNDEGHYACFATNIIGTSQSTQAFLDVTGDLLNVSIPQSSYSVLIGQQVTILCIVTGTPTQTNVFWRKVADGVQTNVDINGNSRYTGGTTSSPLLTITNTQRSDEGIYVCHATNLVGTSNSQNTFLDVAGGM
ncbi:hemicentin-1-like [Mytilus trossulus]|uniref:hemicentin-1-like n=1 Tax=Mytilus trossulus TaxID=6551 RepID=UPI00300729E4